MLEFVGTCWKRCRPSAVISPVPPGAEQSLRRGPCPWGGFAPRFPERGRRFASHSYPPPFIFSIYAAFRAYAEAQ
eukprot:12317317-Alexandrium_andersonii.AAC.1